MNRRAPLSQSGSLTSDRLNPKPGKKRESNRHDTANTKPSQELRSPAVRALKATIQALEKKLGTELDPLGGCFCQARSHALASHVPICSRCGLILCELNPPYFACPHCTSPLLTDAAKAALLDVLSAKLDEALRREAEEAERALEEARAAEGAFPLLRSSSPDSRQEQNTGKKGARAGGGVRAQASFSPFSSSSSYSTTTTTHKVLSLNSKTKRVTVASYSPAPPSASPTPPISSGTATPVGAEEDAAAVRPRVPPPSTDLVCTAPPGDVAEGRPWTDIRNDGFACPVLYQRDKEKKREKNG